MIIGRQQGIALVLVLWVITLLAVIAGNFAYSMRGEAQITQNMLSAAQARAFADAGVERAWFELMKPQTDGQRWMGDGAPHMMIEGNVLIQVSMLDESGKIDLNLAPDALLKSLLQSAGLDEQASSAMLDKILDWRDPDSLRRPNGAEEPEYRAAGMTYMPSNAPFETVGELRRVLGMTPELYRRIAPALTVYSRQPNVNASIAPPEVLLALPGATPALVAQFVQQRSAAFAAGQLAPPFPGATAMLPTSPWSQAYSVRSQATMPDGTVFVREAVVRVSPNPKRPVTVLAWFEGEVRTEAAPVSSNAM